jgi:predicted nucleic acid-binding Zn ribbon protein
MSFALLAPGRDDARRRHRAAVSAVRDEFGFLCTRSQLLGLRFDAFDLDDVFIQTSCEMIERSLGIHLPLPLMVKTAGELGGALRARARPQGGTRMSDHLEDCPVAGCSHAIRPGQLMCARHWNALPEEHKRAVNATLASLRDHASMASINAYRAAKAAAIAAVNGGEL